MIDSTTIVVLGILAGMVAGPCAVAAVVILAVSGSVPAWGTFGLGIAAGALLRLARPFTWYRLARYGPRLVTGRALGRCWPCHVADRSRRWCVLRFVVAPEHRHGVFHA